LRVGVTVGLPPFAVPGQFHPGQLRNAHRGEKAGERVPQRVEVHANALFNWLVRQGRMLHNPLKPVVKLETRGKETFKRRALTLEMFWRLVEGSGKRALAYLVAGFTGLRRGEMKQLLWADIRLDAPQPYIDVRAETTKSKKGAVIPLVPVLVEAFQKAKTKKLQFSDRVFPRGLPSVKSLSKDLAACGIPLEDERGYRVAQVLIARLRRELRLLDAPFCEPIG
jgi:integrase